MKPISDKARLYIITTDDYYHSNFVYEHRSTQSIPSMQILFAKSKYYSNIVVSFKTIGSIESQTSKETTFIYSS